MSRFGNLEFEDQPEQFSDLDTPSLKDESHYMREARDSFENADFEKALRYHAKALEFNPANAAAFAGQVRALIELGELHEALLWSGKALEQFPHDSELLALKAMALGRSGDLDGALAFSDAAVEERGNTPTVWLARADVLLSRGEARAEFCFDKAQAQAPGDWFITWLAARIRAFHEQYLAAMRLLERAIQQDATHFVLWLDLGNCQNKLGLAGASQVSFARAIELNPLCEAARHGRIRAQSIGPLARLAGFCRSLFHK
jgi:tetratricopeptide (TPR) repeat protein